MALTERFMDYAHPGCVTSPVALGSRWMTVVDNSALTSGNNITITDPDNGSQVPSGCTPIHRLGRARILRVRLVYSNTTGATVVKIRVFGRTLRDGESSTAQVWQIIRPMQTNPSRSASISIATATDIQYGTSPTLRYTNPSNTDHAWIVDGYDEIVIGVEDKWKPTSGDEHARLEARMY